jgi:IclR family pca regulon transcriptional regulator
VSERPAPGDDFVQALARGLDVITAFDRDHRSLTLSAAAARTELSRATARRLLKTLVELGYVRFDGREFALTPQILRLGTAYLSGLGLPDIAQPHLEKLSTLLNESTSAAVLDGTEIVYVARVATRKLMNVGITVGTRFPAHATSMGRVLLAGLDETRLAAYFQTADLQALTPLTRHTETAVREAITQVRRQGWAEVDQELELGLRSLAAPIIGADGSTIAAINVSMAAALHTGVPSGHVEAVRATSAALSADASSAGLVS